MKYKIGDAIVIKNPNIDIQVRELKSNKVYIIDFIDSVGWVYLKGIQFICYNPYIFRHSRKQKLERILNGKI